MKKSKIAITKQTQIGEVLKINPNVKEILLGFGLHCFGCPMSQMETIEEAAMVHGIDLNLMLEKLNEKKEIKPASKIKLSKNKR